RNPYLQARELLVEDVIDVPREFGVGNASDVVVRGALVEALVGVLRDRLRFRTGAADTVVVDGQVGVSGGDVVGVQAVDGGVVHPLVLGRPDGDGADLGPGARAGA